MQYYSINLQPRVDLGFCFLDNVPVGTESKTFRMAEGIEIEADYPKDARVYMDNRNPGIKLPSLIGNTNSFLIVSGSVKNVIERMNTGTIEYLPVSIYNHKKRLASSDYFIINPIGSLDCLDLNASEITYFDGHIVTIDKYVLAAKKLAGVLDLFRIKDDPRVYVISHKLALELKKINATNFYLFPLEQTP
jgi:hypothetical protein